MRKEMSHSLIILGTDHGLQIGDEFSGNPLISLQRIQLVVLIQVVDSQTALSDVVLFERLFVFISDDDFGVESQVQSVDEVVGLLDEQVIQEPELHVVDHLLLPHYDAGRNSGRKE